MKMPGEHDSEEGDSSAEEDNDEGMGDLKVDGFEDDLDDKQEEEK